MNSTVIAERQAIAIQAIQRETARLGGEFALPGYRASSPAAKYVLILEAVAQALSEIGQVLPTPPDAPMEPEPVEPTMTLKTTKRKGNL